MKQSKQFLGNNTQRYALFGILFGLLFPIGATVLRLAVGNIPLTLSSIFTAQASDSLLWVIDTAPIFLGIFAGVAGYRQDVVEARNSELRQVEGELRTVKDTLEERVIERTSEFEKQTIRLRVAGEIARDAASSNDLEGILERASQLIKERFNFYHTGIYLLDNNKEYAVLTASPTEAGKQMIAKKHKIRVGEIGAVGRVAATGEPRIIRNTGLDAAYFNNPLLPDARSAMTLPLKVVNIVIGVLDVQSELLEAFSEYDIAIMQALADQIAIAIERARLLQQLETNLRALEQAYGSATRGSWKSLAESRLLNNIGYRFDNIRIQPIQEAPALGIEAIRSGSRASEDNASGSSQIAIPIKIRGIAVGAVTVRLREGSNQNTINTIEQAVDRLAGSLESARLFEEARLRADREQAISQVTAAISSAPEFDAILRTTVEEIGRSLGDSEVSIQIVGDGE